jgi:predicted RNase H-like HicB family nuclease
MKIQSFTALIEKSDDGWYVGQLEEIPEVLSQGKTIKELMENLKDALTVFIQVQKEETAKNYIGKRYIRRKLSIVS